MRRTSTNSILPPPRLFSVYWQVPMATIHLRLLGTSSIERNGEPLPLLKNRKALALLAYLALSPGAHTRSRLAGLLWSDAPEKTALDNLRFVLWSVNKALGAERGVGMRPV